MKVLLVALVLLMLLAAVMVFASLVLFARDQEQWVVDMRDRAKARDAMKRMTDG